MQLLYIISYCFHINYIFHLKLIISITNIITHFLYYYSYILFRVYFIFMYYLIYIHLILLILSITLFVIISYINSYLYNISKMCLLFFYNTIINSHIISDTKYFFDIVIYKKIIKKYISYKFLKSYII